VVLGLVAKREVYGRIEYANHQGEMMKKIVWLSFVTAAVSMLLVSGAVYAEGGEPPAAAPDCVDCAQAPLDDSVIMESAPAHILEEAGTPVELKEPDLSVNLQGPVAQVATGEALPGEAQNLEVTLLNAQGEPLDMASQDTADVLTLPDPYYFFGGQKQSFTSIMDAINDIISKQQFPDDGLIYVEDDFEGNPYAENVVIDGVAHLILSGLKGLHSEHGSAYTTIDGSVTLNGLTAGFTLKGFTINGLVDIKNNTGNIVLEDLDVCNPAGIGIVIGDRNSLHQGSAALKEVKANDNFSHGATIFTTGNITVTNASFDGNGGDGLRVESTGGTITLKGITASRNDARGIYNANIGFSKTFILQHVQVNNNGLHGVDVGYKFATGAFVADNVYVQNNNKNGLTTPPIEGFKLTTLGAVILKNVLIEGTKNGDGLNLIHNSFTPVVLQNVVSRDNDKVGLSISSDGNITLTSVKSTENILGGAVIRNDTPGDNGTIIITSPVSAGTAGANDFSNNSNGIGLDVRSNKNITLTNLVASGNGKDGVYAVTVGNLTISKTLPNWANGLNGNSGGNGIFLRVDGNVILGYCEASNNNGSGVNFNSAAKSATVTGGKFDNNGDNGLYINVSGNVVLADIESASNNDWDASGACEGIKIEGATNVTLKNASKTARTAIGGNSGNGLSITSTGSVTITGVNAWSNRGHGVYISNRVWPYGKPVTLTRIESIFNSAGQGIYVYTAGSVSMQDIFTAENSSHGLQIDACVFDPDGCLNLANVTLKGGNNAFSNNGGAGLDISTKGSVNLSHVDVYGNDAGGVKIFNALNGTSAVTIGGIVLSKIDANMNYGLWVESRGAITLKNLIVQNITDFGFGPNGAVHLSNKGPAKMGVTVSDVEIYNNERTGLFINTDGLVSLQGVTSSYNSITGGWIDEDNSTNGVRERLSGYGENEDRWHFNGESGDTYTITLSNCMFKPSLILEDAFGNQLDMDADADEDGSAVILFSPLSDNEFVLRVQVSDWGNGVYELTFGGGIYDALYNNPFSGAAIYTPMSVKVSSSKAIFSSFNANNGDGLYVSINSSGLGSVSLANVGADNNNYNGVSILAPNGNVSLSNNHARVSGFSWNGFQGVKIVSGGTITLNNRLLAIGNGREGFYLDNGGALAAKTITIKNVQAWSNISTGLTANSLGNISVTNLDASANNRNGASLSTLGNVTLLGSNVFSGNDEHGLNVAASGVVSITGVMAEGNLLDGLDIQSNGVGKSVLVKNTILRFNQDSGLKVDAQGAVTLDNVQSVLNLGSGVDLNDNGVAVLIKNSMMMGNSGYGIKVEDGLFTLVNTYFFGNTLGGLELY
jgi:hypothetical protein